VREKTGGIPVGFKLSAQHIEKDIDAALEVGVDYIILDGRGGGTGAAPLIFRDNISVPTLPCWPVQPGTITWLDFQMMI
jgi:glutamate synthase domain-containing protein 2